MDLEESKDDLFAQKRICIKTKQKDNILEKFKIIVKGKNFVIRDKEMFDWSPVFNEVKEVEYCTDDESVQEQPMNDKEKSQDPFNFYDLLRKRDGGVDTLRLDISIPYPPGFTPEKLNNYVDVHEVKDMNTEPSECRSEGVCSRVLEEVQHADDLLSSRVRSNGYMPKKGGLGSKAKKDWSRELIGKHKVYFLSLKETKMESISEMDDKILWGNSNFEYLFSEAIGDSVVMVDFHEVRSADERIGSVFNIQGASDFNDFISNSGLVDIQLEGYSFTWSHPLASKISKLDRFLVTEGVISLFPYILAICLDRHLSDHRPILLHDLVIHAWNSTVLEDSNGMVRFKKKMQALKKAIREWVAVYKREQTGRRNDIKLKLSVIDKQLDQGRAIEGDENSKFFHGVINRKRANLAIRGAMVDGEWVDDPRCLKEEFFSHFATRFHAPSGICNKINFLFPNQLNSNQMFELEKQVSTDEIRTAVWACGENKSLGPDGFTFEFFPLIPKVQDPKFMNDYHPISLIGSLYKVVTKILALRLSSVITGPILDVQTAFLPSRQILDGPFVINELLSWCEHKKPHAMIFKVDFDKAYDSIRWDLLDDVLQSFGFGFKWRLWILGSLSSRMAFVLVNESPTTEFQFHCGLKQGDPLALYLFILVMESLHLSFSRVVDAGIFKAIHGPNIQKLSSFTSSIWNNILKEVNILKDRGVDLISRCKRRVGNGMHTQFWSDVWLGDQQLRYMFPCIYALEENKECSVAVKLQGDVEFSLRRQDLNENGVFCVKDVRKLLDESFLPKEATATRWVKFVPIKINVFAWKVSLDRLPTRVNLMHRGIYVSSLSFPICSSHIEDTSHLLFSCTMAADVTSLVCRCLCWKEFSLLLGGAYETLGINSSLRPKSLRRM
nr:RNA-directed DNA polymerase, eukaryota [Tanacetum cinerariifolium]